VLFVITVGRCAFPIIPYLIDCAIIAYFSAIASFFSTKECPHTPSWMYGGRERRTPWGEGGLDKGKDME
jgi:hypothetical protein